MLSNVLIKYVLVEKVVKTMCTSKNLVIVKYVKSIHTQKWRIKSVLPVETGMLPSDG